MKSSKEWLVYMLLCDQKTFYVGITTNIKERITQHRTKESVFTKQFSDIELIYCEQYPTEHNAAIREKQIKGWSHTKKQLLLTGELGINSCTEVAKSLLSKV